MTLCQALYVGRATAPTAVANPKSQNKATLVLSRYSGLNYSDKQLVATFLFACLKGAGTILIQKRTS